MLSSAPSPYPIGTSMTRVSFLLKVKAEKIEEHKAHHKAVWPDMLAALSKTGWHNYSLFMPLVG